MRKEAIELAWMFAIIVTFCAGLAAGVAVIGGVAWALQHFLPLGH